MMEEFVDEEFADFDEIEAFFYEVEKDATIICASLKDDFAVVYCPNIYEEGVFWKDYYLIRLGKSYLKLYRELIYFKSPKTNGWVMFDIHIRLNDLINIVYSPFNLELPDSECDNDKLNFDNVIPDKDIIVKIDIDKIKKKLNKYEVLRLFL